MAYLTLEEVSGAFVYLLIGAIVVLFWPYRGSHRAKVSRLIAAPPEKIWDVYHPGADNEDHDRFHTTTLSCRQVGSAPEMWELAVASANGPVKTLYEVLGKERPTASAMRVVEMGGRAFPYGQDHRETFRLEERPDGTLVSLEFFGTTSTLLMQLLRHHLYRGYLSRLQRFCESGQLPRQASSRRSLWTGLGLSALAVASFAALFGWIGGLFVAAALLMHEFGHWAAMRMTGQPAPRIFLIPFIGGIAVANRPHRTLLHDAFCSLMGPGLSLFPAAGLLIFSTVLGIRDLDEYLMAAATFFDTGDISFAPLRLQIAVLTLAAATITGALNLLQLVPMLPLDGGQVLRAVVQSFSPIWAHRVLLLLSGLGIVAF
ncbi:MAG TPA: site-2 protease family protein, partial [Kiloniellaceae bacterium]|nr:site-2 protease family protein [Kiloniellaceae bacterium]